MRIFRFLLTIFTSVSTKIFIFADVRFKIMKKKTIWTIAIIMGFSFLGLLFLQLKYIQAMVDMKKEQFDESVNRALYQASRNLELNETLRYLEKDVNETERRAFRKDSVGTRTGNMDGSIQQSHQYSVAGKDGTVYSSIA